MPFVNPVTINGLACPVVVLAGVPLEVTVYDNIGEPPFETGGVKLTVACIFPSVAVTLGSITPGTPGTTAAMAVVAGLVFVPE